MHHYNSTQYCNTETVFLTFPFLLANITSQMWLSGGGRGRKHLTLLCSNLPIPSISLIADLRPSLLFTPLHLCHQALIWYRCKKWSEGSASLWKRCDPVILEQSLTAHHKCFYHPWKTNPPPSEIYDCSSSRHYLCPTRFIPVKTILTKNYPTLKFMQRPPPPCPIRFLPVNRSPPAENLLLLLSMSCCLR